MIGLIAGVILFLAGLILWRAGATWDAAISAHFRLAAGTSAATFFSWLTDLGGAAVMIPTGLFVAVVLAFTGRILAAAWLVLTITSGRIAVEVMKYLIGRARPPASLHLVDVVTPSFPSSHSPGTALTVLALLVVSGAVRPLWLAGFALIILIGLSRIMLGVHWPSDVMAGWGFGIFWVSAWSSGKFLSDGAFSLRRPLRIRD